MKIIFENRINDATLTATPPMTTALPVDNLKIPQRGSVARTVGMPASQVVWGNLASIFDVSGMALGRHNLSAAATARLELYNGFDLGGTLTYDSGVVSVGAGIEAWGDFAWGAIPVPKLVHEDLAQTSAMFFATSRAASFRLTLTDTGNTYGYMDIGRLVLGVAVSMNPTAGLNMFTQDGSTQTRTESGSLRTESKGKWRSLSFDIAYLDPANRAVIFDSVTNVGLSNDVLVSTYAGDGGAVEMDGTFIGKLTKMPEMPAFAKQMWRSAMTIEEV